jgi:hypothetical protein
MKYPFVIFYRKEIFNSIDNFFIQNSSTLDCSIFIADSLEYVKNLHNSNFQLLITYGDNCEEYYKELLTVISKEMLERHIHISTDNNILTNITFFNYFINNTYINICSVNRVHTRPTFSLFTPSYNSYDKILRVYNSLQKQTLLDWEWVIIDDSPDDLNFQFLRTNFSHDARIRFYRRSNNNGSIGNVKNETIGLCRGKYLVEMDHDDELMPYVLQESADLFDTNPQIGFIYYDCACVYENGTNQWYGDFICKGIIMEYWSWLLAIIGVAGIYFVGRKTLWGWFVLLFNEAIWVIYAIKTEQYGFIVSAIAYGIVYIKSYLHWKADV